MPKKASMQKQHFQLIAEVLRNFKEEYRHINADKLVEFLVDEFCYKLEDTNQNFDETKFRQAVYKNGN